MRRTKTLWAVLVVVGLLASTGCVSKKLFRRNVEETDARVASVESGVEANEKRIGDLRSETDSKVAAVDSKAQRAVEIGQGAMNRAEAAAQRAEEAYRGRLIWEITLSNDDVRFSFNQAAIPNDAQAVLDGLVSNIKSLDKAVYVEIEGHTDSTGTETYNYELGEQRASTVRDYMARQGIPLHAMNVISYGESNPVADNATSTGRAQNRRVVVRVLE